MSDSPAAFGTLGAAANSVRGRQALDHSWCGPTRVGVECHTARVPDVEFTIVLRGYDMDQVNDLIRRANRMLGSPDPAARGEMQGELRHPGLRTRMRGYDRSQVDQWLARLADQLTAR
jgi:DivIVA domain-containing protein